MKRAHNRFFLSVTTRMSHSRLLAFVLSLNLYVEHRAQVSPSLRLRPLFLLLSVLQPSVAYRMYSRNNLVDGQLEVVCDDCNIYDICELEAS